MVEFGKIRRVHPSRAVALALFCALCLLMAVPSLAQTLEGGVKFGVAVTSLASPSTLADSTVEAGVEPTLHFGGFLSIPLTGPFAFQPEAMFAAKGQRIHDKDAVRVSTSTTGQLKPPPADRVILLRYFDLPLLVRLSKQTRPDTSLYVLAGPAIGFRRGAVVRKVVNAGDFEDIVDRVSGHSLAVIVGGGFQRRRVSVEGRLTQGLQNVAIDPQPAEVKPRAIAVLLGVRL